MSEPTRFFCQCGRLLTADDARDSLTCATCGRDVSLPGTRSRSGETTPIVLSPRAGTRIHDYRIEALLGQGGMGSVYRAVHLETGEAIALKLLLPSLQMREDFVTRFRREARAAASLEHPNIVRVLDYGVDDSGPYLAMELLEGRDLLQAGQSEGVDEMVLADWMLQIAGGLKAASARGITHRDVKPGNLLLLDDGTVKIADFGLAKATDSDSHLTMTGEVLGTPHYMSPEQGRGGAVDFRSDLYSLGAAFYHVLANDPPFTADSPVAVIMQHLHELPKPLLERRPGLSVHFAGIVHRLLEKAPEDRYPSYDVLMDDLRRFRRGQIPKLAATPPARVHRTATETFVLPQQAQTEFVLRPAGLIRRSVATAIDLALLEVVLYGASVAWSAITGSPADFAAQMADAWTKGELLRLDPIPALLLVTGSVAYFALGDARGGRSFGKRRTGLRVCRPDGRDGGQERALVRVVLVLPGLLLLSATFGSALLSLTDIGPLQGWLDRSTFGEGLPQHKMRATGLAWLGLLWLLARLSGSAGLLHDALTGIQVYRAKKQAPRRVGDARTNALSPTRAFFLSFFPGAGLVYVGSVGPGLAAMVGIPLLIAFDALPTVIGAVWLVSGLWAMWRARQHAERARHAAAAVTTHLPDATAIRRQES